MEYTGIPVPNVRLSMFAIPNCGEIEMSTTIVIIGLSAVVIAVLIATPVLVNKSIARKFFIEHYGATDAESIAALEKLADAKIFTSLNAAAICVGVQVRKSHPSLKTTELKKRFNDMWGAGSIMRKAHDLERSKQLSDAQVFKVNLGRFVVDPRRGVI